MTITTIFLLLYLLLLVFIGFRSFNKIKSYSDFFIARKSGSYSAITGSLVASILGGSAVIGTIDAGKNMGWATAWFMLSAAIGLLALIPLTKRVSQLGRYTLPDLLEDLYGKKAKLIASLIIPVAWLGIVAAQLIASARILQSFTGLNYSLGVVISGAIFISYTIAGGQLSVLKTDFFQAILIVFGLLVLSAFSLRILPEAEFKAFPLKMPFNQNFRPIDLFILIITYSTTFTAGPDIYSRIFCASDEKIARRSVLTTGLVLIPVAFLIAFLSVFGALLPETETHGASIVEISKTVLPGWAIPIIVIALLSAVLSSADTTILSASIIVTDLISKSNFTKRSLNTTRVIIFLIGSISILIAINFTSIIGMLLMALTVYSGAFILPILFGLSKIEVQPGYVSAAIIAGGIIALIGKILESTSLVDYSNAIIIGAFILNALLLLMGRKKSN